MAADGDARLPKERVEEIAGRAGGVLAQPMMPKVIMTAESAALAAEVLELRAVADAVRAWADLGDEFAEYQERDGEYDPDAHMAIGDRCQEAAARVHAAMAAYDGTAA